MFLFIRHITGINAETGKIIDTLKSIQQIVISSNELNRDGRVKDRIENITEIVMDAQVIKMSHELIGSTLLKVENLEFSDDDFYNNIVRTYFLKIL